MRVFLTFLHLLHRGIPSLIKYLNKTMKEFYLFLYQRINLKNKTKKGYPKTLKYKPFESLLQHCIQTTSLYVLQCAKFNYTGKCDCALFSNAVIKTIQYCVKLFNDKN